MADQAVNEMISAFAAGCMDKENLTQFVKYVKNKGDLPYKELGKMQVLVSMLPIILEQEQPPADLKNKVARALISMQDEINEKIKNEREKTVEVPIAVNPELPDQEIKQEEEPAVKSSHDAPKQESRDNINNETKREPQPENIYMNENRLFTDVPPRIVEGPSLTPIWIIIALMFIAVGALAYYSYSNNASIKESLTRTENSLTTVKAELRNASEYINRNSALVDFFNYENIWVVSMAGIDPALNISGKLYIAPNEKEALLQINNLPTPSPENIYQLWLVTKQQTYSIGNFFVEPASRYVKMINLPQVPKEQIERFQITLEPRSGSPLPGGMTYAAGAVNETPAKQGRRK